MKEKTADEVILTPMYEGEVYKYHECSNCKKEKIGRASCRERV